MVSVSVWWIPVLLTILVIVVANLTEERGSYLSDLGCLVFGGGGALVIWLVFFALMYFFGR